MTTKPPNAAEATHGWDSLFPELRDAQQRVIRTQLGRFIADASKEQTRAWDDSIPLLRHEVKEPCDADPDAQHRDLPAFGVPDDDRGAKPIHRAPGPCCCSRGPAT